MISQPALWQRIACHPVGGEQQALLLHKLATEQGWSEAFCHQALGEYRRFVYLACVSPAPVSPSRVVDAVWHLHLTFSRDYWQVFCPRVLEHPLHHDPGEASEQPRMQAQYGATLALYRGEFDVSPPRPVWGPAVAQSPRRRNAWLAAFAALLSGSTALAAEAGTDGDHDGLIAFGALAIAIYLIYRVFRPTRSHKRNGKDSGGGWGGNCGSSCSSASCGSSCGGGGD
jgi:hypothetical protein